MAAVTASTFCWSCSATSGCSPSGCQRLWHEYSRVMSPCQALGPDCMCHVWDSSLVGVWVGRGASAIALVSAKLSWQVVLSAVDSFHFQKHWARFSMVFGTLYSHCIFFSLWPFHLWMWGTVIHILSPTALKLVGQKYREALIKSQSAFAGRSWCCLSIVTVFSRKSVCVCMCMDGIIYVDVCVCVCLCLCVYACVSSVFLFQSVYGLNVNVCVFFWVCKKDECVCLCAYMCICIRML